MRKCIGSIRKVTALLVVFIMLAVCMLPFNIVLAADTNNDDWLHVEGNQIVDMNGNPVWMTGANWFGFNTGTNCFDGIWACNMKSALKDMADHGINLLRLPISVQIILEWAGGQNPKPNVNSSVNPELVGKTSLEIFDIAAQTCKEVGMKIMIDIHSAPSAAFGHNIPVWYDGSFTSEDFFKALEWMANRYKNDDTFIAYDLKNEPHGNPNQTGVQVAKWDNTKDENNWKYAAEQAGKRILAINPNALIMVEGVEAVPKPGYDYTAKDEYGKEGHYYFNWWGGNLRGVKDLPVNLGSGQKQLVYSPHDYGPMVFKQSWFYSGFNKETLYNDCWKNNWAYIYEDKIAPLLIGEWGGFMDGGDNQKWMEALRDYIAENKIHHTFWCFNANSGDTGGLVGYDFKTWDEEKYALLKPALWQNNGGEFIGLDHQTPLGSNGLSLNEYYGGSTRPSPSPSKAPTSTPTPTNTPTSTPTKVPTPTPTATVIPTQSDEPVTDNEFNVASEFIPDHLVPNQMMTVKVTATNVSKTSYTGVKDVLVIVGLYDTNNTMVNVSYISKGVPYHGTEILTAGFKLPANINGYQVKSFMWDGDDIKTSNMIPISNEVHVP